MSGRITELFNNNVFTDAEMKARLPKKVYNEVKIRDLQTSLHRQ